MKITVCTQIKNRLYQFCETFQANVASIQSCSAAVEWIIVDYESTDGLDRYIQRYLQTHRFIKYYRTVAAASRYSIPVAKNLAVRLSTGDFVFNLDGDNFLDNVLDEIQQTDQGIYCHEGYLGTYGRIGLHREVFKQIGGYDEGFYPASVHDNDLIVRCQHINYSFRHVPSVTPAIPNDKAATIENFSTTLTWKEMQNYNLARMHAHAERKLVNPNGNWFTPCTVVLNFSETLRKTNEF